MKGILKDKMNAIYECTDLDECKRLALQIVEESSIRPQDKIKMHSTIFNARKLIELQTYLTNSFFVYNKMGLK